MAITTTISTKELQRIAQLAYEGKTLNVMLCNSAATTVDRSVSTWQSEEVTATGYARFSQAIGTGTYNATTGRYELPVINASFTAVNPYSYNRVVLYIAGATWPHSVLQENPAASVAPSQTVTYRLTLNTDD